LQRRDEQFSDAFDIYYNILKWTGMFGIGTPYKEFPLQIDTGSSVSWVVSSRCTEDRCKAVKRFDTSESSTAKIWEETVTVIFGLGLKICGRAVRGND
jgi:hypothetical protein